MFLKRKFAMQTTAATRNAPQWLLGLTRCAAMAGLMLNAACSRNDDKCQFAGPTQQAATAPATSGAVADSSQAARPDADAPAHKHYEPWQMPDVDLLLSNGERWTNDSLTADRTVFVFLAYDCPHSKAAAPRYERILREHRRGGSVAAVYVLDSLTHYSAAKAESFAAASLTLPHAHDDEARLRVGCQAYSLPTVVVIDRENQLVARLVGNMRNLEERLARALE
jgi:thiol-disulfide isomerase/thioredoxin